MPLPAQHKVVIIGCGNVAWHLAERLSSLRLFSISVYNHRPSSRLRRFSDRLGCSVHGSLKQVDQQADYYLICVSDRAISPVAAALQINNKNALLAHCSGSMDLGALNHPHARKAVLYPLQSFSTSSLVRWEGLPVLVEASGPAARKKALELAGRLSTNVHAVTAMRRLRLHLAAVMVNNFSNALFVAASDLLTRGGHARDFELLKPLMTTTVAKLDTMTPLEAQTGPARRGDADVQKKHLALLKNDKDLARLYRELSKLIAKQHTPYA